MRHTDKSHAPSIVKNPKGLIDSCCGTDTFKGRICSTSEDFTNLGNAFFTTLSDNCCRA